MMKVENILIFIVVLSSATLSAQNMIKIEPFLAIEGGRFPSTITLGDYAYVHAAASTVVFSPYNRIRAQGSSQGYYPSIGATFEYPVTKRFSFRAGIAYANRHFKADRIGSCVGCEENLDSYPVETIFRLGYIDIPLSARFYFLSKRITLYSDAGLTTSPRLHNETVIERFTGMSKPDNLHIHDAPFHEIMLMAQFGMGAGIKFNRSGINLSGVYRNGLTKFAATNSYRFKSWGVNLALFFKISDANE
jgi:hypothetical protein